ncbi:MAG: CoA-binding protein [Bacteroidota bacterium]
MKTVVIGASTNPDRYAYMATEMLVKHGHEVVPVGINEGAIGEQKIITGMPDIKDVDTVTLYLSPRNQEGYIDYILESLKPRRIIFNPGTENPGFETRAKEQGIEAIEACTLVMLSTGQF